MVENIIVYSIAFKQLFQLFHQLTKTNSWIGFHSYSFLWVKKYFSEKSLYQNLIEAIFSETR